jgi:hypothetical protein
MNRPTSHEHDIVADCLEQRAANHDFDRAPIFYNALAGQLGFPPVDQYWHSHPLCGIFDLLDREDVASNRPLRTALVVSKERGLPGEGFFKTMALLRGHRKPATDLTQQTQLWTDELIRLLAHYQTPATNHPPK